MAFVRRLMQALVDVAHFRKRWTYQFFEKWLPRVSLRSTWRLRAAVLRDDRCEPEIVSLRFHHPVSAEIAIRVPSSDARSIDEVFYRRVYEETAEVVGDARTILDLGANVGAATIWFCNRFPSAHIVSVEPHPQTFRLLERNTRLLVSSGRCKLQQAALVDQMGPVFLSAMPDDNLYDSVKIAGDSRDGSIEVVGTTIDEVLTRSGFDTVDLMKVDVEGSERALFSGALDWLDKVRVLAIEFHDDCRAECNFDRIMRDRRFSVIDDGHTTIARNNRLCRAGSDEP